VATFVILRVIGLFMPLRMSQDAMEIGDIAEHGHEVYPSDIPSLGVFQGVSAPSTTTA
jgi:Amt family ammonium transporter